MKLKWFVWPFIFGLVSCATHPDVRPSADGIHRVVIKTADADQGSRNAIRQANNFCEKRGQNAAFVKEEQKYTGDVDEQTYKNVKRASKVAKTIGGAAYVFGGEKESNIGGIVGVGGAASDAALGKGYTVDMRFKCI